MGRKLNADVTLSETTWEAVAAMVLLRPWTGRCERCGRNRAAHPHHRWLKRQGGLDVPSNIAALCAEDHRWVHENVAEAVAGGWIVQAPYDFRGTPIRLHDGMVALLNDFYGYDVLEYPQNPSWPGSQLTDATLPSRRVRSARLAALYVQGLATDLATSRQ